MANQIIKPSQAVLGHNARTFWYTGQTTSSLGAKIAHDKLATKRVLQKAGLPTPRLHATIRTRKELKSFRWTKLPSSFVLKPRSSYGGGGILVMFGRNKKGNWVKADKTEVFIPALRRHVLDILDGSFSSSNVPDVAFFEQRVKNHPDLKPYCYKGIADIRVVVYNNIPVMAMLRLPTKESGGKANLHAGGIGVGIDLARGLTTTAVYHGHVVESLPDSRLGVSGIKIPGWKNILQLTVRTAQAVNLPFAGVDVALDRDDGPLILEINARPGLDIQLANMAPLRSRLLRIEDLKITNPEKGVRLGRSLFGVDLDQEVEDVTGQAVLGATEPVDIIDKEGQHHSITAKVDTGAWRTTIDSNLAKELNIHGNVIHHSEVRGALGSQTRPIIELKMKVHDRTINTEAFIADRTKMKYEMIIGRRDLKGFLVDPFKK